MSLECSIKCNRGFWNFSSVLHNDDQNLVQGLVPDLEDFLLYAVSPWLQITGI